MSRKKGKGSQSRKKNQTKAKNSTAKTKEPLVEELDEIRIALSPFGQEVFGTTPVHQIRPGDYMCDRYGEIIRIFDELSRGGIVQWHEVMFDEKSGEYIVLDDPPEDRNGTQLELIDPHEEISIVTGVKPPKKNKGNGIGTKQAYEPKGKVQVYNRKGPEVRVVVKETGEIYETDRFYIGTDMRASGMPYTVDADGASNFVVGINQLRFKETTPTVQMCGFDATEKYVEHFCGKKLDLDDKDFYRKHQWTGKDGIGLAAIPTVIHQLVEPYRLGVSRIRFPAGLYCPFEDREAWMAALGENPLQGDNYDFADQMGQDFKQVQELFRIDYADVPWAPSICAHAAGTTGGGHVSYIGPRGFSRSGWQMSVCIAPLDSFQYKAELKLTPPGKKKEAYALEWDEIRDEQGNKVIKPIGSGYTYKGGQGYNNFASKAPGGSDKVSHSSVGRGYSHHNPNWKYDGWD